MDITQHSATKRDISPIFLFALTLFSSASLMFILQPMFGKALLPLLGGSASVWNTCMVFYQSLLFLGYLYAHLLATHLSYRKQFLIHCCLIIVSLNFLPVSIPEDSIPPTGNNPSIWLLTTLLVSIGLPFFILSTTSPLLQKWFSLLGHQTSKDPYYLSIASNSGSLLALLSYPFILEPEIGLTQQQQFWSIGFVLLSLLISACMLKLKHQHVRTVKTIKPIANSEHAPGKKRQFQWLLLAIVPSSLLLGTTNYISIDIATVPLLWVIPLALYLLSFIIVFSRYNHTIHKKTLLIQPWIVAPFLIFYFSDHKLSSFSIELFFHLLTFFISIMVCHGELAKKRPATDYLTQYYLIMSFGGMLGGVFNSFIAPFIFSSIYEYPIMIVFALLLNPIHKRIKLYLKTRHAKVILYTYLFTFSTVLYFNFGQLSDAVLICLSLLLIGLVCYFILHKNVFYFPLLGLAIVSCTAPEKHQDNPLIHQSRNFYGVLSVRKNKSVKIGNRLETFHELYSGSTSHGAQFVSDYNLQCTPNSYYSDQGPLGDIFNVYDTNNHHWQVGVIGLGAGEMAGYAKDSQQWTFFEINPAVIEIANNPAYFTFLHDCIDHYDLQIGDARISLENSANNYDVLVIDAFTSDAIPTHLLTREAIALYLSRLNPNGLLVFHISNRYLALQKILSDHAQKMNLYAVIQKFRPNKQTHLAHNSDWAILAKNESALSPLLNTKAKSNWHKIPSYSGVQSWTDDFTSIMNVWK